MEKLPFVDVLPGRIRLNYYGSSRRLMVTGMPASTLKGYLDQYEGPQPQIESD